MRNIIIALSTALMVLSITPAHADYRYGHRHGYQHGYQHGGGNWVAPLVGGLIVGGIIGGAMNQPRYYDERGYHTECRRQPVYDQWGNFLGYERQCYRVPNY